MPSQMLDEILSIPAVVEHQNTEVGRSYREIGRRLRAADPRAAIDAMLAQYREEVGRAFPQEPQRQLEDAARAMALAWDRSAARLMRQARGAPPEDLTHAIGLEIMGEKMLVMVVVGAVLVATIVSGVVLAAHRTRYDRFGDDLRRRPADDPQPGGVGR